MSLNLYLNSSINIFNYLIYEFSKFKSLISLKKMFEE